MVTYSIVVVLFLIFMIAVTWGADFGFARLILAVFG
jgi:preprotein translocase subunit SecE